MPYRKGRKAAGNKNILTAQRVTHRVSRDSLANQSRHERHVQRSQQQLNTSLESNDQPNHPTISPELLLNMLVRSKGRLSIKHFIIIVMLMIYFFRNGVQASGAGLLSRSQHNNNTRGRGQLTSATLSPLSHEIEYVRNETTQLSIQNIKQQKDKQQLVDIEHVNIQAQMPSSPFKKIFLADTDANTLIARANEKNYIAEVKNYIALIKPSHDQEFLQECKGEFRTWLEQNILYLSAQGLREVLQAVEYKTLLAPIDDKYIEHKIVKTLYEKYEFERLKILADHHYDEDDINSRLSVIKTSALNKKAHKQLYYVLALLMEFETPVAEVYQIIYANSPLLNNIFEDAGSKAYGSLSKLYYKGKEFTLLHIAINKGYDDIAIDILTLNQKLLRFFRLNDIYNVKLTNEHYIQGRLRIAVEYEVNIHLAIKNKNTKILKKLMGYGLNNFILEFHPNILLLNDLMSRINEPGMNEIIHVFMDCLVNTGRSNQKNTIKIESLSLEDDSMDARVPMQYDRDEFIRLVDANDNYPKVYVSDTTILRDYLMNSVMKMIYNKDSKHSLIPLVKILLRVKGLEDLAIEALISAIHYHDPAIVRNLLAAGVNPSGVTTTSQYPLAFALSRHREEIVDTLFAAGSYPYMRQVRNVLDDVEAKQIFSKYYQQYIGVEFEEKLYNRITPEMKTYLFGLDYNKHYSMLQSMFNSIDIEYLPWLHRDITDLLMINELLVFWLRMFLVGSIELMLSDDKLGSYDGLGTINKNILMFCENIIRIHQYAYLPINTFRVLASLNPAISILTSESATMTLRMLLKTVVPLGFDIYNQVNLQPKMLRHIKLIDEQRLQLIRESISINAEQAHGSSSNVENILHKKEQALRSRLEVIIKIFEEAPFSPLIILDKGQDGADMSINPAPQLLHMCRSDRSKQQPKVQTITGEVLRTVSAGIIKTPPTGQYDFEGFDEIDLDYYLERPEVLRRHITKITDKLIDSSPQAKILYYIEPLLIKLKHELIPELLRVHESLLNSLITEQDIDDAYTHFSDNPTQIVKDYKLEEHECIVSFLQVINNIRHSSYIINRMAFSNIKSTVETLIDQWQQLQNCASDLTSLTDVKIYEKEKFVVKYKNVRKKLQKFIKEISNSITKHNDSIKSQDKLRKKLNVDTLSVQYDASARAAMQQNNQQYKSKVSSSTITTRHRNKNKVKQARGKKRELTTDNTSPTSKDSYHNVLTREDIKEMLRAIEPLIRQDEKEFLPEGPVPQINMLQGMWYHKDIEDLDAKAKEYLNRDTLTNSQLTALTNRANQHLQTIKNLLDGNDDTTMTRYCLHIKLIQFYNILSLSDQYAEMMRIWLIHHYKSASNIINKFAHQTVEQLYGKMQQWQDKHDYTMLQVSNNMVLFFRKCEIDIETILKSRNNKTHPSDNDVKELWQQLNDYDEFICSVYSEKNEHNDISIQHRLALTMIVRNLGQMDKDNFKLYGHQYRQHFGIDNKLNKLLIKARTHVRNSVGHRVIPQQKHEFEAFNDLPDFTGVDDILTAFTDLMAREQKMVRRIPPSM